MSTILKALRRLEDEKRRPANGPLRDEVVGAAPAETLARRSRRAPALALGAAAAVLVVGAVAWWARPVANPAEPAPAAAAAAAKRAAPAVRTAPSRRPARAEPERAPPALGRALPLAAAEPAPRANPPPGDAAQPAPAHPPLASAPAEAAAAPPPPVRPAPRPAPAPEPAARPQPPAAPAQPPAAVAPAARHVLPELVVASTIWHPDPLRRRALVELEGREEPLELRQGDAVGSLVVSAIEPSGVVFLLGGVEVRRRVGEQP